MPTRGPRPDGLVTPPRSILRLAGRAIADFRMIRPTDRVLLALSGGKDSLALLQLLAHLRHSAPVDFDLEVVTVDPCTEGFRPAPLRPYVEALGLVHHYKTTNLHARARSQMRGYSFSAFAARIRRGIMYRVARERRCTVLALAQHLDDIAESFLMSLFHGGELRTMKAHYRTDAGDLRVIRPLCYCRERQLRDFATSARLPVIPDTHSVDYPEARRRRHFKALLEAEEAAQPGLMRNLLHAMRPLLEDPALRSP